MTHDRYEVKKRTLTLDDDTIEILIEFGNIKNGSSNISAAIRSLSRYWKDEKTKNDLDKSMIQGVSNGYKY